MSDNFTASQILNDRYELKKIIGRGGFSIVWLAADAYNNNSPVAVKIFAPDKGLEEADIHLFEQEKQKSDRLKHPRLLKVLDYFVHGDSPCLVMVYMPNGSLEKKIKENPEGLPEEYIAKMLYQVADALEYLHKEGIAHLDIKPDNILYDSFQDFVVADFGISSDLRSTMLRASKLKGETFFTFLSPERILGNKELTERVDIFALGVTLYEMCQGITPDGFSVGQLVAMGRQKPELPEGKYSKRLQYLLHACWHSNPVDRPSASKLKVYAKHFQEKKFWPEITEIETGEVDPQSTIPEQPGAAEDLGGRKTEVKQGRAQATFIAPDAHAATVPATPKTIGAPKTRLLIAAAACLLLLIIWGAWAMFGTKNLADYLIEARKALLENRLSEAFIAYQQAARLDPQNKDVAQLRQSISDKAAVGYREHVQAAEGYLQQGAYTAAQKELAEARTQAKMMTYDSTDIAEQRIGAYMQRDTGDTYYKSKDAKAIDYYKKANVVLQDPGVAAKIDELEEIQGGATIAQSNKDLISACKKGNYNAAKLALDSGAKPNTTGGTSGSAILYAAQSGNLELVKLLVSRGADPNNRSGYISGANSITYGSPAVAAAAAGKLAVVRYLIENCKVPVNDQEFDTGTRQRDGWSPLGAAARFGHIEIVQYLHQKGANLNVQQTNGKTPLLEASCNSFYYVVEYLLRNGADIATKDNEGVTACDCSRVASAGVRGLLAKYGCKVGPGTIKEDVKSRKN